jgi:hypothetical protein
MGSRRKNRFYPRTRRISNPARNFDVGMLPSINGSIVTFWGFEELLRVIVRDHRLNCKAISISIIIIDERGGERRLRLRRDQHEKLGTSYLTAH